jgi:bacteriorhodopsin
MVTGSPAALIEGRIFHWGRYIDWVIITPLLLLALALLALALLALARWQRNIDPIIGLTVLDVLFILTGLRRGPASPASARGSS